MSFGNVWIFPGGKVDEDDKVYGKKQNFSYHQQCALRETFEECGIFLWPYKQNLFQMSDWDSQVKQILTQFEINQERRQKGESNLEDDFRFLQNQIDSFVQGGLNIDQLKLIFRFMTPAGKQEKVPVRFDTRFFCYHITNNNFLNWGNLLEYKKIHPSDFQNMTQNQLKSLLLDSENLVVAKGEASEFKWMNPKTTISDYLSKQISLAFPQFLIMNILSSFYTYDNLINYINQMESYSEQFKKTQSAQPNQMQFNLLDFPMLITFNPTSAVDEKQAEKEYNITSVFSGDKDYPFEYMLDQEQDSNEEFKKNFVNFYFSLSNQNQWEKEGNRGKMHFKKLSFLNNDDFISDVNYNFPYLFSFLKSREDLIKIIQGPQL